MTHPEIPGNGLGIPVMPYGFDGDNWIAFLVTELGRLEVSLASLPTGAATIADGADVALGALADAVVAAGAVGSVSAKLRRLTTDLDALLTELKLKADLTEIQPVSSKDGDKLFGFERILAETTAGIVSGEDGYIDSPVVDHNKVWLIHIIMARDVTSPLTETRFTLIHDVVGFDMFTELRVIAADERVSWSGSLYLDAGDYVRARFIGSQVNDSVQIVLTGIQMNRP